MRTRDLFVLLAASAFALSAPAESVTGAISITKKLTKRNVTPDVSVYQRGAAVELGKDPQQDPLAFEMSRVVLYLEGPGPAGSNAAPQIAQLDRRFVPDLVVIPAGSTVSFPNMDPIFHNVFSLSKAKAFDLGAYDKGETKHIMFPKPGIVEVYCHLHPNMAATIVITPNRWYARVDASGQYHIDDVPPGTYTLVAWHKSAGFFRRTIVVGPGHDAVANFVIPIMGDSKPPEPDATGGQAQ
jgi:plastocyanin